MDKILSGTLSNTWTRLLSNELGRLSQGVGTGKPPGQQVVGTNTICFIPRNKVPVRSKVTYAYFICDVRPLKEEEHRVKLTVGGEKLDYCDDPASSAVSLLDTKIFINSFISDAHKGAIYGTADITKYYKILP